MKHLYLFFSLLAFIYTPAQSYTICLGQTVSIVVQNSGLTSPSYSLQPGSLTSNTGSFAVSPSSTTNYTGYVTGTNSNNIVVTNTVSVVVNVNVMPANIFSVTSLSNFTLGCAGKSTATVAITQLNVPPGGVYSYSFIPPGQSATLPPGPLNPSTTGTMNTPGQWTVVVRDMSSGCDALLLFSILSNTFAPNLQTTPGPVTLTCGTPTIMLKGNSATPNAQILWTFPGVIGSSPDSAYASVNAFPSQTLVANYTSTATDPNNLCTTQTIVPVYQSIMKPAVTAAQFPSVLTCNTYTGMFTNTSITNVQPVFSSSLPVSVVMWQGPGVLPSGTLSTYPVLVPGVYSLTVKDNNNGCINSATFVTSYDITYPAIQQQTTPYVLCTGSAATITAVLQSTVNGTTYAWTAPPSSSYTVAGASLVTNSPGYYTITATNPNGCKSMGLFAVTACVGIAEAELPVFKVYPNPVSSLLHVRNEVAGNFSCAIIDALGKTVMTGKSDNSECMMDVSALPAGLYFIQLKSSSGTRSYRFVRD